MPLNSFKILLFVVFLGVFSLFCFAPFSQLFGLMYIIFGLYLYLIEYSLNNNNKISKKYYFIIGYIFGCSYFLTQLYWVFYCLYKVINVGWLISIVGYLLFAFYLALYFAISTVLYVLLRTKSKFFNLILLFPSIWVFFEWVRGRLFTGFPWYEIGYSQVNNQVIKGLFPIIGSYGVGSITLSIVGFCIIIFDTRSNRLIFYKYFASLMVILFVLSLLGNIQYTKPYGRPISVDLIQGNINQDIKWGSHDYLSIYENLIKTANADLIIIPETAISDFSTNLPPQYLDNLINIVKQKNADLIIGMPKIIDKNLNYVNAAILLSKKGQPFYAKYHLVPYGEYIPLKFLLGKLYSIINLPMVGFSHLEVVQTPLVIKNQLVAFNICYENGFNDELIINAKNATIMANLSDMIWYGSTFAKDHHLQISQVRALENQRYFLQDTNNGETTVIRPDGSILSKAPSFKRYILKSVIYGVYGYTPFQMYGNYLIITLTLIVILISLLKNKKTN